MLNEEKLKLFERNCVNIGYHMCKAEVFTVLIEILKECKTDEELKVMHSCKERIAKLECVWKRQEE